LVAAATLTAVVAEAMPDAAEVLGPVQAAEIAAVEIGVADKEADEKFNEAESSIHGMPQPQLISPIQNRETTHV
jgi:hypothetical protein